mgnify:CR=1 FL=1
MRIRILVKGIPLFILLRGLPAFLRDYAEFKRQAAEQDFPFGSFHPCLDERGLDSGTAKGHYFHQDLLVANRIFQNTPAHHVDIGSRVDGFVAHVASFRQIEVMDIRNLKSFSENVVFRQIDLSDPEFSLTDYCDSLSCLHALEHFGLGRYGDRVDYRGHIVGWKNMGKMLQRGGKLYFSVPIGEQRVEFNAHRVFSIAYIMKMIEERYRLDAFSYVNDDGDLVRDPPLTAEAIRHNFSCHYGCGIFELTKH